MVTSWWKDIDPQLGASHGKELIDTRDFWGAMIAKGSKTFRHDGSQGSARHIVNYLVDQNRPVILDIQDQMINKGKTRDQTTAGRAVQDEISRLKEHFAKQLKDLKDDRKLALKERDAEHAKTLQMMQDSISAKMKLMETDRDRLHENMENLQKEREKAMDEASARLRAQIQEIAEGNAKTIRDREFEIETLKLNNSHNLKVSQMRHENEMLLQRLQQAKEIADKPGCSIM